MPSSALYLYEFRYRCPLRKRWVKARYRATLEELGQRYAEWETIGEPEIRMFDPNEGYSILTAAVATVSLGGSIESAGAPFVL